MLVTGGRAAEGPPTFPQLPAAPGRGRSVSPRSPQLLSGPGRKGGEKGQRVRKGVKRAEAPCEAANYNMTPVH